MKKSIIAMLAAMIVLATYACAIGVTPAITKIAYMPGEIQTGTFSVTNTENKTVTAAITQQGPIEAELSEKTVQLNPKETKQVSYSLTIPSNLDPGKNNINIMILELPSETAEGTQLSALAAVITTLQINVPYDGKEIEAAVDLNDENQGKVGFVIAVTNLGNQPISDLNAQIEILDSKMQTESTALDPQKRTELKTEWIAPTEGSYQAKITITYDGKTKTITKEFNAGKQEATYHQTPEKDKNALTRWDAALILLIIMLMLANVCLNRKNKKASAHRQKRNN